MEKNEKDITSINFAKKTSLYVMMILSFLLTIYGILVLAHIDIVMFAFPWDNGTGLLFIGIGNISIGIFGFLRNKLEITNKVFKQILIITNIMFLLTGIIFLGIFIMNCLLMGHC